jgi:hypothetical protein
LERQVDEWKMALASEDPIYTDKPLLQRKLGSLLGSQPKGLKRMILRLREANKQTLTDFLAGLITADNHELKTRRVYVTNLVYLQGARMAGIILK